MFQWLFKLIIRSMEITYVFLDARIIRPPSPMILGIEISSDFQNMSRRQLCNHAEMRFKLDTDSLWALQSTNKIRLACQLARNMRDAQ